MSDRQRPSRFWPKVRHLLLMPAGLSLLVAGVCGCGAPPSDMILDLVRPVALMESTPPAVGGVSLSRVAQRFVPPKQMAVYQIMPAGPVTRESMDSLADRFGFGPHRGYGESYVSAWGNPHAWANGALSFPRMDDVGCFQLTGGAIDAFEAIVSDTAGGGEAEEPWIVDMGGWYQAYMGEVRLVGPGSKIAARADSCHLFAERAVESDHAVTIRPVEAALEDLWAGRGEVPPTIDNARAANITVDLIELCYYAPPVSSAELYYRPVYVFHVTMSDGTLGAWTLPAFDGSTAEDAI